jgi:hypothetical protein
MRGRTKRRLTRITSGPRHWWHKPAVNRRIHSRPANRDWIADLRIVDVNQQPLVRVPSQVPISRLYLVYEPFTPSLRLLRRNDRMVFVAKPLSVVAVGLFGRLVIRLLEVLFGLGIIGSALVVVITFVEDLKEVFSKDEPPQVIERSVSTEHIHA